MPSHTTTTSADYLLRRLCDAVGSARYSARAAMATPSCSSHHQIKSIATSVRFCQVMTNLVLKEMTSRVVRVVSA